MDYSDICCLYQEEVFLNQNMKYRLFKENLILKLYYGLKQFFFKLYLDIFNDLKVPPYNYLYEIDYYNSNDFYENIVTKSSESNLQEYYSIINLTSKDYRDIYDRVMDELVLTHPKNIHNRAMDELIEKHPKLMYNRSMTELYKTYPKIIYNRSLNELKTYNEYEVINVDDLD